jgi:hypothetical protein
MTIKHNKKRNVGLLNEFFAQYMASAAVDFRFDDYNKAEAIWKKHFDKKTELGKELMIFENIVNAKLKDRNIAFSMLREAKKIISKQNMESLEKEKTNLLHEINVKLQDVKFFDRPVENFKTTASIQILLNSWRETNNKASSGTLRESMMFLPNFSELSHIEEKVIDFMVEEKNPLPPFDQSVLENTQEDIDRLVVDIFRQKINEKYSNSLNEDQKEIIGLYVFSNNSEESKIKLQKKLQGLKENIVRNLDKEIKEGSDKTPRENLKEVRQYIEDKNYNIASTNISKNTINFYLAMADLKKEFERGDER